jgi:cell division protein FtsQ
MKKNIDIPVLKQRILWTVVMCTIATLLVLTIRKKTNTPLGNLNVQIANLEGKRNLISSQEVVTLFKSFTGITNLNTMKIGKVEAGEFEELLRKDKRIKSVDVFIDGNGKLTIEIIQRQPIVRMLDGSSKSYYLDTEGNRIPVVLNAAIRVPLATGNFELYEEGIFKSNKPMKLKEVFNVSKIIAKDAFMKSLVEQIDVDDKGEIVLVPKIGRHYIVLGDTSFMKEKIENLKIMYKEGLPREGWNKYTALILKYRGQVVGRTSEVNIIASSDSISIADAGLLSPKLDPTPIAANLTKVRSVEDKKINKVKPKPTPVKPKAKQDPKPKPKQKKPQPKKGKK